MRLVEVRKLPWLGSRVFLLLMLFFMLLPFFMMFVTAFKSAQEINDVANRGLLQRTLPDRWLNFDNFKAVISGTSPMLHGVSFLVFIRNSLIITLVSLVPAIVLAVTAGYGFAKFSFPGKNVFFFLLLGLLMVPIESISIPLYLVVARLGLVDTYLGIMLPFMISAFGMFMIKQAVEAIPQAYIEAARVDGCGEFWILFHVVLPMIRPTVVTLVVIKFLWTWNEYFWPYLVTNVDEMKPITVGLAKFTNELFQDYGPLTASVVLTIIPTLVIFILSRRFIVRSVAISGLKAYLTFK
jgi:ABC-type glycerol-3-phosphate transport system permease component